MAKSGRARERAITFYASEENNGWLKQQEGRSITALMNKALRLLIESEEAARDPEIVRRVGQLEKLVHDLRVGVRTLQLTADEGVREGRPANTDDFLKQAQDEIDYNDEVDRSQD